MKNFEPKKIGRDDAAGLNFLIREDFEGTVSMVLEHLFEIHLVSANPALENHHFLKSNLAFVIDALDFELKAI